MDLSKYLFVYFVGNKPEEERLHFAVSEDGYHFTPLNNNRPVIEHKLGKKCVRDPYIFRGNDSVFYIVATDMKCEEGWLSNHAIVTWRSDNLIDWYDETIIDIRDFGGELAATTRAWAPQAIWDRKEKRHMIYWANSTENEDNAAIYYAYTDDFKSMTYPKLMYARKGIQTIDSDIIYNEKNDTYYHYFKHDEDCTIALVKSKELTGPYEEPPVIVSHAQSGVEGCELYNIDGTDTWIMIMDEYGKGRFVAERTTDFENFTPLDESEYDLDFSPRHGSIMKISTEEYNRLVDKFGK